MLIHSLAQSNKQSFSLFKINKLSSIRALFLYNKLINVA